MFKRIKEFFTGKTVEVVEVPYKVESSVKYEDIKPQAVVLTPATPVADRATQAVVESLVPAKKSQAKKPASAKKVAATKPKQPRQRKPKATK
jgi:hypothetical protein